MKKNRITIDDVAKALGISKTTVSRAISGRGRIGEDTRERVLEYIKENNYRPSPIAKGLAEKRTYNIAVVWPIDYGYTDLPFFHRCVAGMNKVTSTHGYDILICMIKGDDIGELERVVGYHKVEGVVLTRTLVEDPAAEYLLSCGFPFVAIGSSDDEDIVRRFSALPYERKACFTGAKPLRLSAEEKKRNRMPISLGASAAPYWSLKKTDATRSQAARRPTRLPSPERTIR